MLGRIDDDFAQREVRSAGVPRMARQVEAARLLVEMGDPQALLARVLLGEATGEELSRRGQAVEGDGDIGTLMQHRPSLRLGKAANDSNRVGFGGQFGPN